MARCAQCNIPMLISKVSNGELRYCSTKCAATDFVPKLLTSLAEARETDPLPFSGEPPAVLKKENPPGELGEGFETASPWESMKDVLILGLGSAMVLAIVVVIQLVFAYVNYPFFEQTFLFVIPLGAGFCGLIAGGGFWFALRKLDRLPTKLTYVVAFFMGLIGYVFIYYLIWLDTDIPGGKLRNVMPFSEFLQTWILNQRIRVGRFGMGGKPIELGQLGYGRFALNLLGFALGSVISVSIAGGRAYCPICRRYYRPKATQIRHLSDPIAAGRGLHLVGFAISSGRLQEAVDLHAMLCPEQEAGYLTTTVRLEFCPGCGVHRANLTAQIPGENGKEEVPGIAQTGSSPYSVTLPSRT